uniref:Uncharacterized protein n=1 Tax=Anolis carolinensis TaxID=28377 RepID=A0A803TGG5_ANOCA
MEVLKKWLGHPKELYNLAWFKMGGYTTVMPKMDEVSWCISRVTSLRLPLHVGVSCFRNMKGHV